MFSMSAYIFLLTHWGRMTHICVGKQTIIGSDNGLSPGRRQAIIWTNPGILLIGPLGTNFSEILIGIQTFSFRKMHLKVSSGKWRPFCLGLNELIPKCVEDVWIRVAIIDNAGGQLWHHWFCLRMGYQWACKNSILDIHNQNLHVK